MDRLPWTKARIKADSRRLSASVPILLTARARGARRLRKFSTARRIVSMVADCYHRSTVTCLHRSERVGVRGSTLRPLTCALIGSPSKPSRSSGEQATARLMHSWVALARIAVDDVGVILSTLKSIPPWALPGCGLPTRSGIFLGWPPQQHARGTNQYPLVISYFGNFFCMSRASRAHAAPTSAASTVVIVPNWRRRGVHQRVPACCAGTSTPNPKSATLEAVVW
jgi:hypothetical protein